MPGQDVETGGSEFSLFKPSTWAEKAISHNSPPALTFSFSHDGNPLDLPAREFGLLHALLLNAGRVLTHRQLLREVWGPSHAEQGHYLRVYMGHLRQKLEADPSQPQHLLTETAVGYRLMK